MKNLLIFWVLIWTFSMSAQVSNVWVRTVAGSSFQGHVDGQGTMTMFNYPSAIAHDGTNLWVFDPSDTSKIRKISSDQWVTTALRGGEFGGDYWNLRFTYLAWWDDKLWMFNDQLWWSFDGSTLTRREPYLPTQVSGAVGSGDTLFIACGNRIYSYRNGNLQVFVGSGNSSNIDGQGIFSSLSQPTGLCVDSTGNLYTMCRSAQGPWPLRRITRSGVVTTLRNDLLYAGSLVYYDSRVFGFFNGDVIEIWPGTNVVTGLDASAYGFNDGSGHTAQFNVASPLGSGFLCAGSDGIFVADSGNYRIRQIQFTNIPPVPVAMSVRLRPSIYIEGPHGFYQIEARNELNEPWTIVDQIKTTTGNQSWVDTDQTRNRRFYRAIYYP
jgi:hypothetical protein